MISFGEAITGVLQGIERLAPVVLRPESGPRWSKMVEPLSTMDSQYTDKFIARARPADPAGATDFAALQN